MKIYIRKLKDDKFKGKHPNGIVEGYERTIKVSKTAFTKPTVGQSFALAGISGWFITSEVVKIIDDNHFNTLNSKYYWKIIK